MYNPVCNIRSLESQKNEICHRMVPDIDPEDRMVLTLYIPFYYGDVCF